MFKSALGAIVAAAAALAVPGLAASQDSAPSAVEAGVSASAIAGPFAIGATVKDRNGETVGRITRLTTAPSGHTLVMLRLGVDSFAVPAARLRMQGNVVVSNLTKDELKAEGRLAQK